MRLLAEMRADGLIPNAFCYNAAVTACSRAGRTRQALEVVREMETDAAIQPTIHTYTSVMKACGMAGEWRTTMQMLERMQRSGLTPTAFHFGCAVDRAVAAAR